MDIEDLPRPEPRPGLKLCDCGLPAIPGTDMCERCAMLDYGTTSKRALGPQLPKSDPAQHAIVDLLLDYRRGRTFSEIHERVGGLSRETKRALEKLEDSGRIERVPCRRQQTTRRCWKTTGKGDWGFRRREIIEVLRDRPGGATVGEIIEAIGGDPSDHREHNSMQYFLLRQRKHGRIVQGPCERSGKQAMAKCYFLDTSFARRKRAKRHR